MKVAHTLEDSQERAALFALGALPPDEARSFEDHLTEGCEVCARELASFSDVVDELSSVAPAAVPGDHVRAAVLERIAAPVFDTHPGMRFVRSGQLDWQPGSRPSISVKPLFRDAPRGYKTLLIRLEPNTGFPEHRHGGAEEIYLLEGEVTISGVVMRAGDYCRAEAGTVHDGIFSRTGCLFLVLSSEGNDPLV
jgi:quercetin dioxygenase-like cupin family protein